MRIRVLLLSVAVLVFATLQLEGSTGAQGTFATVDVDVRIDCLAGRGVSFSLVPWSITVKPGDSINWKLDPGSNVTEMQVVAKQGRPWPYGRKPPYNVTRTRPAGARALDPSQRGRRYQYAVTAVCVRDAATSDTVIIDPDLIIPR